MPGFFSFFKKPTTIFSRNVSIPLISNNAGSNICRIQHIPHKADITGQFNGLNVINFFNGIGHFDE